MRTVIVATDFSAIAENAVEYAAAAASNTQSKLILFNSFKLPLHASNTILSVENVQAMIDKNKRLLRERADALQQKYKIEVAIESSLLNVEEEIEKLIEQHGAEAVIMGMAQRSLEQDLLGNTTTNLIQKLKFPVLAIPKGVTFRGIKKILFACDVTRGVQKKVLDRVKDTAQLWGAEVEVFNVQDKLAVLQEEDSIQPASLLKEGMEGIQYLYKNVASNAIIKEIKQEIMHYKPDIVIMVPNRYGFWASIVHRSKTRMMAAGLDVPLFSIPL